MYLQIEYTKWGPHSILGDISLSSSTAFPLYFYYTWNWPPYEDTWKARWQQLRANKPAAATVEAARRYYSAKVKEWFFPVAEKISSKKINCIMEVLFERVSTTETIVDYAKDIGADLIVIGHSSIHGFER